MHHQGIGDNQTGFSMISALQGLVVSDSICRAFLNGALRLPQIIGLLLGRVATANAPYNYSPSDVLLISLHQGPKAFVVADGVEVGVGFGHSAIGGV